MLKFRFLTVFVLTFFHNSGATDIAGPAPDFGARDIFAEYRLPRLKDGPADAVWKTENDVQVLARARVLTLNAHSATEAWIESGKTFKNADLTVHAPRSLAATPFLGTRASDLNLLLARPEIHSINLLAPVLKMDAPLVIMRNDLDLDFGHTHLIGVPNSTSYLIQIREAVGVRLSGGVLSGQGWGILVADSRDVSLINMELSGLLGGGMVITGSQTVTVWGSQFHDLGAAPLLLHGATQHSVIANNEITHNLGGSNWHAGIVITDRNADLEAYPKSLLRDDNFGVKEQRITERLTVPQGNIIAFNHIADNHSSGIYSDGGARNIISGNRIDGNSKEGLCLDNGSTANVVALNIFEGNGKRWGNTDEDLKRDFILNLGRLPDGSSPAKVPAISIDNAAYNQIMFNELDRNFGGGIKMVRTSFYNILGLNTVIDNNEGRSRFFHYFGIELGSATADVKVIDLDFAPSRGNEIFGNIIRGNHYAGVFFADGSDNNVIFDNTIFGATDWAMESVTPQHNETFNNLTNLKLRNIGSGLDPGLLKLGTGEFDKP